MKEVILMNNDNRQNLTINWYPGHMAKTRREIAEKMSLIDIVYEVIDARMPLSSKIVDIDSLIKGKPKILIVTKYDLCDKKETDTILEFYKKQGYQVVPVDLLTGKNVSMVVSLTKECMTEMNLKRKEKGMKPRSIRALIVGSPNVGKSTLINRLVGKKATVIGNRPGVTKNLGWIRIHKDIELLDSPGILWPKLENQKQATILACFSAIREEILDVSVLATFILKILMEYYPYRLLNRYGLDMIDFSDIEPTLSTIAKKRGALAKGGEFDYDKVYQLIVRDFKEGMFGPITLDRLEERGE